jgi:hypothetical protein
MFYKSILNAVAVAVAVMFVGCGGDGVVDPNDPNNPNNGGIDNELVGDWSVVEIQQVVGKDNIDWQLPDHEKLFFSFKSSGDVTGVEYYKLSDFWIESIHSVRYSVEGDTMCLANHVIEGFEGCWNYSISGNTLTMSKSIRGYTVTFDRANLVSTRNSLGRVYSQDPELVMTTWYKENNTRYKDRIEFWTPSFDDDNGNYISYDDDEWGSGVWYTEGNRIIILKEECDKYETVVYDEFVRGECVSNSFSVTQTVTLDYQLTNGGTTLRLRPTGSTVWDEWTRPQRKSRLEKGKHAVSPFGAFAR